MASAIFYFFNDRTFPRMFSSCNKQVQQRGYWIHWQRIKMFTCNNVSRAMYTKCEDAHGTQTSEMYFRIVVHRHSGYLQYFGSLLLLIVHFFWSSFGLILSHASIILCLLSYAFYVVFQSNISVRRRPLPQRLVQWKRATGFRYWRN